MTARYTTERVHDSASRNRCGKVEEMTPTKQLAGDIHDASITRLVTSHRSPRFVVVADHRTYVVMIGDPTTNMDGLDALSDTVERDVLFDERRRPMAIQGKSGDFVPVIVTGR